LHQANTWEAMMTLSILPLAVFVPLVMAAAGTPSSAPVALAHAMQMTAQAASADSASQSVALTPAQAAAIDRYVSAEMSRERIPGAEVGIYRDGGAVLEKGYGIANIEWNAAVTPTTLMQSASVGKQFAATAVMMLVEQGKVSLDDSIVTYFPDAPSSWKPIKLKNLLSNTSGLAEYEDSARIKPGALFDIRKDFTEDEMVKKIETLPIEFKPGDDWNYRNTNYVLLGVLIHKVTGQFYGDYLHDRIFVPLGMTSTRIISESDIIPGRAAGYEIKGGQLRNQTWVAPSFNTTADGSLYFNVVDLEKWDRDLYGTSLVSKASLDTMWTPFVLNNGKPNDSGYGFGWFNGIMNGHRVIFHDGAGQGFACTIERYVDDKLTVVVLTNLDAGHSNPGYIARVVAGLVEPAVMPQQHPAIADTRPDIARRARDVIGKMLAGDNLRSSFDADAGYTFDPGNAAEIRSRLPAGWEDAPFVLIARTESDGKVRSVFRAGRVGDTRIVVLKLDEAGMIGNFSVRADPDNR
jgi:CubicO group peptidase (beta-lactamase class C family)